MSDPVLDRADKLGLVTGLGHLEEVVPRLEVDVLLHSEPDCFNLFLIAYRELMDDPDWDEHPHSFFQIAGIHGLPNEFRWMEVEGKRDVGDPKNLPGSGYCEHASFLFPTWHRPYLCLLEQALYRKMLQIASRYSDEKRKSEYLAAVKKFRLPYWDYHRPRNYAAEFPGVTFGKTTKFAYDFGVPQIYTLPKIKVRMAPDDELKLMDNPLYSFTFPSPKGNNNAMTDRDWSISQLQDIKSLRKATTRWTKEEYANSLDCLNQAVNEYREDGVRQALLLMEDGIYNKYEWMSCTTEQSDQPWYPNPKDRKAIPRGSLEGLHNNMHNYVGGDPRKNGDGFGHMQSVPVAAFDPIFFAHHCNIDRLFAIWQASHSGMRGSWFDEENKEKLDEPLRPFLTEVMTDKKKPICWTSAQSQSTFTFGYTYDDIVGVENGHAEKVQKMFKEKYEWARRLDHQLPGEVADHPPESLKPLDLSKLHFFQDIPDFVGLRPQGPKIMMEPTADMSMLAVEPSDLPLTPGFTTEPSVVIDEGNVSREWYVDMTIKKMVLDNSFSVMYFIGPRDDDSVSPKLDPSFAGLSHIFTAPLATCRSCMEQVEEGRKVRATAPITSMLLDYVLTKALPSLSPEHVQPFLIKHLKWIIMEVNGQQHDTRVLAEKGDFDLNVSCKVSPVPGNQNPVVYETYPQIIAKIIQNSSKGPSFINA